MVGAKQCIETAAYYLSAFKVNIDRYRCMGESRLYKYFVKQNKAEQLNTNWLFSNYISSLREAAKTAFFTKNEEP